MSALALVPDPADVARNRLTRMQESAGKIRAGLAAYLPVYIDAVKAGDWRTLGYPDLAAWRDATLGEGAGWQPEVRQWIVGELARRTELTDRELADAAATSPATANRDRHAAGVSSATRGSARQKSAGVREQNRPQAAPERTESDAGPQPRPVTPPGPENAVQSRVHDHLAHAVIFCAHPDCVRDNAPPLLSLGDLPTEVLAQIRSDLSAGPDAHQ